MDFQKFSDLSPIWGILTCGDEIPGTKDDEERK